MENHNSDDCNDDSCAICIEYINQYYGGEVGPEVYHDVDCFDECEDDCNCMVCIKYFSNTFIPTFEELAREAFKPSRVEYSLSCH
jgi:hypothetical protein